MSEQGEGIERPIPGGLDDVRSSRRGRHLSWTDKAALVLDRMPSRLIVLIDGEFVIRWVNEFALTVLGRGRDDVLGRSALEFVHPDDRVSALDEQARMRAEPAQDLDAEEHDTDGRATLRVVAAGDVVVSVEWRASALPGCCAMSVAQRTEYLRHAAGVDALTGRANRRQFDEWVDTTIGACGIIVADVDGLKPINDRYGHPGGDVVLREVGRRLGQSVRSGDRVARTGGDEFVILCADAADEMNMERVVARVRAGFAAPVVLDEVEVPVSVSIGTARRAASEPLGEAIERADRSLYDQKRLPKSPSRRHRHRPR